MLFEWILVGGVIRNRLRELEVSIGLGVMGCGELVMLLFFELLEDVCFLVCG